MPDVARVALVGYGLGGSVFHAPLIDTNPELELAAVVTRNPERRSAVERRYPRAQVIPDVEELLRDPGDWDLVVVATPNATHFEVAEAALSAGIATVVDKPVTPSSAECEVLASLARQRGVSVIPYHNRRWDGDFLTLRDLVAGGRLGQVWRMESRFERWRPDAPSTRTWKQDADLPASGILYDLGSHLVDQALHLFGRPASVYAEQARHISDADDDTFIAVHFPAGPSVHIWVSSTAAQLGPRFRVLGSEAGYVKYGLDPQEEALRDGRLPGERGWGLEEPDAWGRLGTVNADDPLPTRAGAYQEFYSEVAGHILRGGAPPVDIADAITGLRVLEAAGTSAASGSVVPL